MTHFDLCKSTAEWAMKKFNGRVCLYEYQSYATGEFPDVLLFDNFTTLFEIKMSRADFLNDAKKDSRIKYKNRWRWERHGDRHKFRTLAPELYYVEKPHLGLYRYYVCPKGVIQPEEVPSGWGLYWVNDGKYYKKVYSGRFKRDIHSELNILAHAFRKYANNSEDVNVLVQKYM